jgi:redox-regulated HSP33 family molecular chaperone
VVLFLINPISNQEFYNGSTSVDKSKGLAEISKYYKSSEQLTVHRSTRIKKKKWSCQ